jgi:hypothetical protein
LKPKTLLLIPNCTSEKKVVHSAMGPVEIWGSHGDKKTIVFPWIWRRYVPPKVGKYTASQPRSLQSTVVLLHKFQIISWTLKEHRRTMYFGNTGPCTLWLCFYSL